MDKIVIKCSGLLYAGEHKSDYLYIDNFMPKDGSEYTMRIKASDGKVYLAEFKDGKTSIEQCLIPLAGHLTAELCERIADEYISLSGVFMFPVFDSIQDTEETPPTYEQAKTLAERAIEAAEKAEEIAENIGTGGSTGTGTDGKSAYEIAVDNGFEGTEEEWLESLKGEKGDKGDTGEKGDTGPQGQQGEKGDTGSSGVYIGSDTPSNDISVWIDPTGNLSAYERPWQLINELTLEEDVSEIVINTDSNGNPFECDELYIEFDLKRTLTEWSNLRFALSRQAIFEMVLTSQPVNLNTIPFKIHAYKFLSRKFCEFTTAPYTNTVFSVHRTQGEEIASNHKFRLIQINRSNGDLYIGAGSTIKIWGR